MSYYKYQHQGKSRRELRRATSALNASQTKKEPEKRLQRWADRTSALKNIMSTIVMVGVIAILVISMALEWKRGNVVLEPFGIPASLEQKGYTSQVVANQLADKFSGIKKAANSSAKSREFVPAFYDTTPDIEVPTANISLKSIIRYVEGLFGYSPTRITGEVVVLEDKQPKLIIRIIKNDGSFVSASLPPPGEQGGDVDALLLQGAQFVMKETEPYILASYMYENGKMEEALELSQYCIYHRPRGDDVWAYILWGLILHDKGRYEEAIAKYQEAMKPEHGADSTARSLAYLDWGLASFKLGRIDEAIQNYRKSIELNPKAAVAYNNWGDLLRIMQTRRDGAINEFKRQTASAAIDPALIIWWFQWWLDDGYARAIDKYQKAIETDPELAHPYIGWGFTLFKQKKYEEATQKFQIAAILNSESPETFDYWARVLAEWAESVEKEEEKADKYREVILKYKQIIRLKPQDAQAYTKCGAYLEKVRDYDAALVMYKKALDINPEDVDSYLNRGRLLREQKKDFKEAMLMYREVVKLESNGERRLEAEKHVRELKKMDGRRVDGRSKSRRV